MNIVKTLIKKLYYAREGRYRISRTAEHLMKKHGLNEKDIDDVFHYGKMEFPNKIKRKYSEYTIGISYVQEEDETYFITSCWKYKNW